MTTPGDGSAHGPLDISTDARDGRLALTMSGRACADALDLVRTRLDELRPVAAQRVHLRLGALATCEPPVAWELLEFVRDLKDDGAEVVLESHPDAVVTTVLLLADVRDDLGLHRDGDGAPTRR